MGQFNNEFHPERKIRQSQKLCRKMVLCTRPTENMLQNLKSQIDKSIYDSFTFAPAKNREVIKCAALAK